MFWPQYAIFLRDNNMCMSNWFPRKHIASEDIKCYKSLIRERRSHRIIAPFQDDYEYIVGQPQPIVNIKIKLGLTSNGIFKFYQGYHSFKDFFDARGAHHRGFNSHKGYAVITECIIPKGSIYYTGVWDVNPLFDLLDPPFNYVSNQLIVTNVL